MTIPVPGYAKPLPPVNADSEPFWRAASEGRLLLRRCCRCGNLMYYPRLLCTRCMSTDLDWCEASGEATIYALTVIHRAPDAIFRADVPYVLALVDLDEGPRMMSNITDCDPNDVKIGQRVKVWFEKAAEGIAIPKFHLIQET